MLTDVIRQKIPSAFLRLWNTLNEDLIKHTGPVSFRTDLSVPHIGTTAIFPADESAEVSAENAATLMNILKSGQEAGTFKETDSITVMQACIVATKTEHSTETDTELHRRSDSLHPIVEAFDGSGTLLAAPGPLLAAINLPKTLSDRDSTVVILHANDRLPVKLDYAGSFGIQNAADARLPEWISEKLTKDDGEVITCDIHKSIDGIKSLTLTLDEVSHEGESRRIIYNEIIQF